MSENVESTNLPVSSLPVGEKRERAEEAENVVAVADAAEPCEESPSKKAHSKSVPETAAEVVEAEKTSALPEKTSALPEESSSAPVSASPAAVPVAAEPVVASE